MMPVMGGCEATRAIRSSIPKEKQPMIVALTANAFQESRDECLRAGMDEVFTKPSLFDFFLSSSIEIRKKKKNSHSPNKQTVNYNKLKELLKGIQSSAQ